VSDYRLLGASSFLDKISAVKKRLFSNFGYSCPQNAGFFALFFFLLGKLQSISFAQLRVTEKFPRTTPVSKLR
jgi:hypothetical protein